ncbi:hypothetical protein [Halalkalicoccus tibetensis]|uniref:DUF8139 domain-containing protein n=1 Tax=Halalkalicoccus tibetensis TaxID=175632 RepID=A0ABD5V573_9EURY
MEDIPQPAPDPYTPGDEVQIYLDPADPDAHTHSTVCEVVDVLTDDLDIQTDRPTDAYSYMLREFETGGTLPLAFLSRLRARRKHPLDPTANPRRIIQNRVCLVQQSPFLSMLHKVVTRSANLPYSSPSTSSTTS